MWRATCLARSPLRFSGSAIALAVRRPAAGPTAGAAGAPFVRRCSTTPVAVDTGPPAVHHAALGGTDPDLDAIRHCFAGETGAEYFHALHAAACGDKKQAIRTVPVDLRESSDAAFRAMIQRTNHEERYALLCNTGGRGTDKSVLLLRDCLRFVSNRGGYADEIEHKHGRGAPIAMYVTFNDD